MYLSITTQGEILARLDGLPEKLRVALHGKMQALVDEAYDKIIENLSGKVLNEKSGTLKRSIKREVEEQGDLLIGYVESEPEPPYAKVQEEGGKGSYIISPSKASLLSFYWELLGKRVALRYVTHPPLPARPYILPVLIALREKGSAEFQATIDASLKL